MQLYMRLPFIPGRLDWCTFSVVSARPDVPLSRESVSQSVSQSLSCAIVWVIHFLHPFLSPAPCKILYLPLFMNLLLAHSSSPAKSSRMGVTPLAYQSLLPSKSGTSKDFWMYRLFRPLMEMSSLHPLKYHLEQRFWTVEYYLFRPVSQIVIGPSWSLSYSLFWVPGYYRRLAKSLPRGRQAIHVSYECKGGYMLCPPSMRFEKEVESGKPM